MLQLCNIKKNYADGDNTVRALRGINLDFRKSDFVSILGPSGCGKTTMLNIIGGLDQYTEGDLIIDGTSTKDYKDRDWDTYRNHSIGFVFQSYHLIPHQSVLQNVELALTLSGVKRKERRRRAKEALEAVGLGDQLRKRPSEMSGGQMQRVAIARALVNNPDILLADEPTGALDTETSVQVMEILKEISKDRLVIMVTHNPELAEKYSTRIIKMLDGQITDDSAPLTEQERKENLEADRKTAATKKKDRKPSMSFATAFGLSLKNLFTKKGRTTLTAFAGSIGIIGIALIWAVSQGTHAFINGVQEDTLSSYPLTLQATTVDMGTLMSAFMGVGGNANDHDRDAVYSRPVMYDMINALNSIESTKNDLTAFNKHILKQVEEDPALKEALTGIQYTYNLDLLVYTETVDDTIVRSDAQKLMMESIAKYMGTDMSGMLAMGQNMGGGNTAAASTGGGMQLWCQMLSGMDGELINPLLKEQYDLVTGTWPNEYDEIVLVVDENNELQDMVLYALGLKPSEEIEKVFDAVSNGTKLEAQGQKWTYEEIMDMDFRVVLNSDCYVVDENTGFYMDLRETDAGLRYLYDNGLKLKVTGIIRPNEEAASAMLQGSIAYTRELTEHVIQAMNDASAVQAQLDDPETDIFTGLPFKPEEGDMTAAQKAADFRAYVQELTDEEKAELYVRIKCIPTQEQLDDALAMAMEGKTREDMESTMLTALTQQMSMNAAQIEEYILNMSDEELTHAFRQMVEQQVRGQIAMQVQQQMAMVPMEQKLMLLEAELQTYTDDQFAQYYDELLEFSESTYEQNLTNLGYLDLESPATINLYASSFENKEVIEQVIADYNASVEELKQIRYTDIVGIMMSSITVILDAITYVLIGFVAISLIVSSIMIGVITLISVQERTKEIGILRAIGASKANVSSMFNAETVIIGFASGLLGVGLTYLLCIPLNALVYALTDLADLQAHLPVGVAVILVLVSVVLTLFSGIIPSRSAAKKDPVVALRTE